ncbi:hypothetical protein BGZ59_006879 [Podila verticillata]|nr:hypothetical protein BGZ59_006879 [Podila verticillata]
MYLLLRTFKLVATYPVVFPKDVFRVVWAGAGGAFKSAGAGSGRMQGPTTGKVSKYSGSTEKSDGQEVENVQKDNGCGQNVFCGIYGMHDNDDDDGEDDEDYMPKEDDEEYYSSSGNSDENPEAYGSNEEFNCKDSKEAKISRWTVYVNTQCLISTWYENLERDLVDRY